MMNLVKIRNRSLALLLSFLMVCPSWLFLTNFAKAATTPLYQRSFEEADIVVGELPESFTANAVAVPDPIPEPYIAPVREVVDTLPGVPDNTNKFLRNSVKNYAKTTSSITADIGALYEGYLEFSADVYMAGDAYTKWFDILSAGSNQLLRLEMTSSSGGNTVKAVVPNHKEGSKTTVLDGVVIPKNTWTKVQFILDTEARMGALKIGESDPVALSMDLKEGAELKIGGYATSVYYRAAAAAESYFFLDNIALNRANQAPVLKNAIEDQKLPVGQEVVIDLSDVFEEPEGETLTYSAELGTIEGTTYTYIPSEVGTQTERITAYDPENASVTASFSIKAEKTDILYQQNFEKIAVGELPAGYTANEMSNADTVIPAVRAVADDKVNAAGEPNRSLRNSVKNTGRNTSSITADMGKAHEGYLEFSAKLLMGSDAFTRWFDILNAGEDGAGANRVLRFEFTAASGANTVKVLVPNHREGSKTVTLDGITVPKDIWTEIRIVIDQLSKTASIKVGDNDPVEVSVDLNEEIPLKIGGFATSVYYRAATAAEGCFYIDDIVLKEANRLPSVKNPILKQSATVGEELTVDLSEVFEDLDDPVLEMSAVLGTVEGTTYRYTPSEEGTVTETITATDAKGATVSTSFDIDIIAAGSSVIYESDFEEDSVDTLPEGWTASAITPPNPLPDGYIEPVRAVADDVLKEGQPNKSLKNYVKNYARTTSNVIKDLGGTHTGLISFETNVYTMGDAFSKGIYFLNSGNVVTDDWLLAIFFNNSSGDCTVSYQVPNHKSSTSAVTVPDLKIVKNTWTHIKVVFDTVNKTAQLTVGDYDPISIDMDLKDSTPYELGGFYSYLYYRAATAAATHLYLDDICIKKVVGNNNPEVKNAVQKQTVKVGTELTVNLSEVFTDPDGDRIGISADKGTVKNNTFTYTPPVTGEETVTLTAIDGQGGSVTHQFIINVTGNNAPYVNMPISDQYINLGDEIILDLSDTFADIDGGTLTYSNDKGTIDGTVFHYTPDQIGSEIVTLSAADVEGATASCSFTVIVNDPNGMDAIILKDDFEASEPNKLPTDWQLSNNAALQPEGYIWAVQDELNPENQMLKIWHYATSAGTINVKKQLHASYSGDFEASFDMRFGSNSTKRYMEFLNNKGTLVFAVGNESDKKNLSVRIGASTTIDVPTAPYVTDKWYHFDVSFDQKNANVTIKIDGKPMGTFDLTLFSNNLDDLNLGALNMSSYYRAATNQNHYFAIDNLLVTADLVVDDRDTEIVEKDFNAFSWDAVSKEPIDAVTKPLNLRTAGPFGSIITWQTSNKNIIYSNGMVIRPEDANKSVTITATFQSGNAKKKMSFDVTVLQAVPQEYQLEYSDDYEKYSPGVIPDGWYMPQTSNVMHENSGMAVVSDPEKAGNKVVKHTNAHIENQTYSGVTMNLDMPRTYTGEVEISWDVYFETNQYDTLFRVYNNENAIVFSIGASSSFKYNVNQVDTIINGIPFSAKRWYHFRILLNTDTGYVSWYIDDQLAAAFQPTENLSKNYCFSRLSMYSWVRPVMVGAAYMDNLKVRDNISHKLGEALSGIDLSAVSAGTIVDFGIPTSGKYNADIRWTSDDESHIRIDQTEGKAIVTRPLASESDALVQLTATATINGISDSRTFDVLVKRQLTDKEAIDQYFEELQFSDISNEPIDAVTTDLVLIGEGTGNVTVSWSSDKENSLKISGLNGIVTRLDSNEDVKLTATIVRGQESRQKVFPLSVLRFLGFNIAQGREILSYSTDTLAEPVENLVDGNLATVWRSTTGVDSTPYAVIDLGVKQPVDGAMISLDDNVKSYVISASNDNLNFKQIVKKNTSGLFDDITTAGERKTLTQDITFSPVEARYIKLEIEKTAYEGMGVRDLQLFNSSLTTEQALNYAKEILKIPYSDKIEQDISLPAEGSHGTRITWSSSNPSVVSNDGKVTRPQQNTDVTLTATISRDGKSVTKQIPVTVIAAGVTLPEDLNDLKPINKDTSAMTDEELFGLWKQDKNQWDIDYLPKLNYEYNDRLKEIEGYVKKGDYNSAKSLLVAYYKGREIDSNAIISSKDYIRADLYINNIFFNPNNILINTFTAPSEYKEINVDVSSYVTKRGNYAMYIMQKLKHEPQAEFYTKEAGIHAAELTVVINNTPKTYPVIKDTYVSPEQNLKENYGSEERMYVKETMDTDQENSESAFPKIWTKDTKRSYLQFDLNDLSENAKIQSATLKLYGKADGGTSEMILWGEGNNVWEEDEFSWYDSLATTYSWNGTTPDFMHMPKNKEEGSDFSTYMMITRASWLSTLTGIYNVTGDEYYAYHAIRLMNNFIDSTKNYVDCYNLQDAGIRAGTLVYTFDILRKSKHLTDLAAMSMIKNLFQMNKALTYAYNFAPDHNHGTFANRGLMRTTLFLPESAEYEENKRLFTSRWNLQAQYLINDDGSYRESSTSYAQTVANSFLGVMEDAEAYGFRLESYFTERVAKMMEWLGNALLPDDSDPAFGDSDASTNQVTVLKAIDNYLDLPQVRYMYTHGLEGTFPGYTSKYYPGSNRYVIMRDNYSRQAMMAQTNLSIGDGRSHTHFDNLSMIAFAYGKTLLVDNGRFNYSGTDIGDWLRYSSEAHNMITMNGLTQGMAGDTLNHFYTSDAFDYFMGTANSTSDKTGKYPWNRTIFFPKSKLWIVNDRVVPQNSNVNNIEQNWHFLPESYWTYDQENNQVETHFEQGANIVIAQVDKQNMSLNEKAGYYAPGGGKLYNTKFPAFAQNKAGTVTYDTVLYPKKAGDTSKVETSRIPLDVGTDTATAFNADIVDGGSRQNNVYYQSYAEPVERAIGDYQYNGLAMYIENDTKGQLSSASIIKGSSLKKRMNGQLVSLIQAPDTVDDLNVIYDNGTIAMDSGSLSINALNGISIYMPSGIQGISFKGMPVSYRQEGDQAVITVTSESGDGKVDVTTDENGLQSGTTTETYQQTVTFRDENRDYSSVLTVDSQTVLSTTDAWDGSLPKQVLGSKASLKVDGTIVADIQMDLQQLTFHKPYSIRLEYNTSRNLGYIKDGRYSRKFIELPDNTFETASEKLGPDEVGIYRSNGVAEIFAKKPIEIVVTTPVLTPPNNNGGGGGGPVTPTTPPTTEPTTPPTTEPTNPPTTEPSNGFEDTKGHWAEEAIDEMHKIGVVNGISETEFSPDTDVTRAEFAAMIARLLGLQNADSNFADVSSDAWYYGSVGAVAQANIMIGADGMFRPDDKITREEMTKVLVEAYAQKKGAVSATEEELEKFTDKNSISDWATSYMAGAVKLGLISGMTETTIAPQENATRAQAAMMFKRLYDFIK